MIKMVAIEKIKNLNWLELPEEVKQWAYEINKLSFTNKTPAECVEIMVTTHYEENHIFDLLSRLYKEAYKIEFTDANRDYIYPASMKCKLPDLKLISYKTGETIYWDIKSIYDEKYWDVYKEKMIKAAHNASKIVLYNRGDHSVSLVDCNTGKRIHIGWLMLNRF